MLYNVDNQLKIAKKYKEEQDNNEANTADNFFLIIIYIYILLNILYT